MHAPAVVIVAVDVQHLLPLDTEHTGEDALGQSCAQHNDIVLGGDLVGHVCWSRWSLEVVWKKLAGQALRGQVACGLPPTVWRCREMRNRSLEEREVQRKTRKGTRR